MNIIPPDIRGYNPIIYPFNGEWHIKYLDEKNRPLTYNGDYDINFEASGKSLKDALFGMIKWIKLNNII